MKLQTRFNILIFAILLGKETYLIRDLVINTAFRREKKTEKKTEKNRTFDDSITMFFSLKKPYTCCISDYS